MGKNKFEANNKLTHTGYQNCALAFCGEGEQKLIPVEGPRAVRCVLGRAHAWGGGQT